MNDEITKKLIEWVESIGNLAAEELPLFAQEVASYGFYSEMVLSIVFLVLGVVSSIVLYKCVRTMAREDLDAPDICFFGILGSALAVILLIPAMVVSANAMIKAKICPKLYVIERITKK